MKNTKKDRIKFVSEIQKIILNHAGTKVHSLNSQACEYEIPLDESSFAGAIEPLKVTLYNPDHQENLYSVFMKHKKFCGLSHPNHKNNFHSCENVDIAIKDFEIFLNEAIYRE